MMEQEESVIRNWLINKMAEGIRENKVGECNVCHMRVANELNINFKSFSKILRNLVFDDTIWDEIRSRPGCAYTKFSCKINDRGCKDPEFDSYKSKVDSGIIKDDFSWMEDEDRVKYLKEGI
jgi:hypothetical protein